MEDVLLVVGVIALGLRREGMRFTPSLRFTPPCACMSVCECVREFVCVCEREGGGEREIEREKGVGCRVWGEKASAWRSMSTPSFLPCVLAFAFKERGSARERGGLRVSGRHQPSFPGVWLRGQG